MCVCVRVWRVEGGASVVAAWQCEKTVLGGGGGVQAGKQDHKGWASICIADAGEGGIIQMILSGGRSAPGCS